MDTRELNHQWYSRLDERRMVLIIEEAGDEGADLEIPAKYEVCETCNGKGTHVNPSIDSHGLSSEDFAEDPEFAEEYFNGSYDVPCAECGGRRVVPVMDESRMKPEEIAKVNEIIDAHYANERDQWHAREYGY